MPELFAAFKIAYFCCLNLGGNLEKRFIVVNNDLVPHRQCDHIGRSIASWATFFGPNLSKCQNLKFIK